MTVRERFLNFAEKTAYPYIINLPFVSNHINDMSILLIGSAASGLCTEYSDVDICILCGDELLKKISENTNLSSGSPNELILEGIQLHYFAVSFEFVFNKLNEFDDICFYLYSTAAVLNDNSGLYLKIRNVFDDENLKLKRKEKAADLFFRRTRALNSIFERETDPVIRLDIAIEIIKHILKVTALIDNVPFDIRKRFYTTALKGVVGKNIKEKADILINLVSSVSNYKNIEDSRLFLKVADECKEIIKTKL